MTCCCGLLSMDFCISGTTDILQSNSQFMEGDIATFGALSGTSLHWGGKKSKLRCLEYRFPGTVDPKVKTIRKTFPFLTQPLTTVLLTAVFRWLEIKGCLSSSWHVFPGAAQATLLAMQTVLINAPYCSNPTSRSFLPTTQEVFKPHCVQINISAGPCLAITFKCRTKRI